MKSLPIDGISAPSDTAPELPGTFFYDYLKVLGRRRMVILQSFILIALTAIVVTLMTKPVYQAKARLLVDNPTNSYNAVDTSNPLSGILAQSQPQTVATQVEVLQSPDLMQQVAQKAGLASISIQEVEDTNVIEATAESTDPQTAATAANTLLKLYIDQDTNQSLAELRSSAEFARRKEQEAHQQLVQAAAQLEAFKRQNHIAELNAQRNAQIQRVAGLLNDIETAQTNLNACETQLAVFQKQLEAQPVNIKAEVKNTNPRIAALQDKLADLRLQRESLTQSGGFASSAPQIITLDAVIAKIKARIAQQPALIGNETVTPNALQNDLRKSIANLHVEIASGKTVLNTKRQEMTLAQKLMNHYAKWDTSLNRLAYNLNNAAALDKMFTDKIADLTLREQAHHATARIEQVAQVPSVPIRPKKAQNILLGCLFGLFVGLLMALLQEYLDDRINTVEDANRILGLPSLGHVPTLSISDARLLPQMQGFDPASESYRILRTNIQFASIDNPIHTLLVTSSSPGEGKTTTAANLAFAMAMDGKKVVLVDTDLRRPALHKLLSLPTMPGLTDVLLERTTLREAWLQHAQMPNLMTLVSGSTPPNPSELLNSRAFHHLVEQLKEAADIVIFDSPPVLVAADASILASQMDGTVLVVEAGETRKTPARQTLALLQNGRANILGVMYNKMHALDGREYYYRYQYSIPALEKTTGDEEEMRKHPASVDNSND